MGVCSIRKVVPTCVSTVLLWFAMKIVQRFIEGCVDCYYILVLLDSSPSAKLHILEATVFRSLRMLPAVYVRRCGISS